MVYTPQLGERSRDLASLHSDFFADFFVGFGFLNGLGGIELRETDRHTLALP
jgi:hypothetical protein